MSCVLHCDSTFLSTFAGRCETTIRPEQLASFSECFITGTTREILPVNTIDDVHFTVSPATVTSKLRTAFGDFTAAYVKRNKKLRVV